MKTAFLICAHDQPNYLAKLVNILSCDWARIFIHIDKKANITEFRKCIPNGSAIFLDCSRRISVNWGGFSVVQAILNLLDESLNAGEHFDRFCLLSGSDFPIKSLDDIEKAFDSENEFMRIDRRLDVSDNNSHCKNVRYYHFMDSPHPKAIGLLSKASRKPYDKISLYHGSCWWALTNACVNYVAEFIKNNEDYIIFHKHTLCADEIFFSSIVKSSPFMVNLTHDFENTNDKKGFFALNEHGCHYIDWNSKGVKLPKVLNDGDFNALCNSKALFGRKFREPDSCNLLQKISSTIAK